MHELYEMYQQGHHQEVYKRLMVLGEGVSTHTMWDEASSIARELMRRVRYNIELIVARLFTLGYQFGDGFWDESDALSSEEKARIEQDIPIFRPPQPNDETTVQRLEQLVGPLPLSLRFWYEEVGCVNLIGLFPSTEARHFDRHYGVILDPLFVYSVDMALKMVTAYIHKGVWDRDPTLAIAPERSYKYSFSGSGPYAIRLPCKAFDAPLLHELHQTTFINYLSVCLRWGGFPGLEQESRLTAQEVAFLTKELLPF